MSKRVKFNIEKGIEGKGNKQERDTLQPPSSSSSFLVEKEKKMLRWFAACSANEIPHMVNTAHCSAHTQLLYMAVAVAVAGL